MAKYKRRRRRILWSALVLSFLILCFLLGNLFHVLRQEQNGGQTTPPDLADGHATLDIDGQNDAGQDAADDVDTTSPDLADEHAAPDTDGQNDAGQDAPDTDTPDTDTPDTTVVFAGDIFLSDYVLAAYKQNGIDGVLSAPLRKTLTDADFAVANNEFPFSTRGTQAPDKQFTFRIDPSYVSVLGDAGIDLVTLANNHALDYGADALCDTFDTLDQAHISYMGAGASPARASRPAVFTHGGKTIGFLAASRVFPDVSWNVENAQPGVFSAYDPSKLVEAVKAAADTCSFLCVYVHWGIEKSTSPADYQTALAHALIDAGADAVIGAHPHVLQGVELYQGKPVFYSLGNFIFYQSIEQTAVAKLTLSADGAAKWQLLPACAQNACTGLIQEPDRRSAFYAYMETLSKNVSFEPDGTIKPK